MHQLTRACLLNWKKKRLPIGLVPNNIYIYDGSTASVVSAVTSSRPDQIFHLASLYSRETSVETVEPMVASNLLIGVQLMEALRYTKIPASIVNFGTYTQYYQVHGKFQSLNVYAALKNAFKDILGLYAEDLALPYLHLILYDSYGIGDWRNKLLPTIKDAVKSGNTLRLSDPKFILDLTHINDVVSAAICAQEMLSTFSMSSHSNRIYSISGDRLSLSELVNRVQTVIGYNLSVKWKAYKMPKRQIIRPWLGARPRNWKQSISLDEGLKSYFLYDNS